MLIMARVGYDGYPVSFLNDDAAWVTIIAAGGYTIILVNIIFGYLHSRSVPNHMASRDLLLL